MTRNRDLKRRIRDRQARTHESYLTARRHVLAQAEPAIGDLDIPIAPGSSISVVEPIDVATIAQRLGFRCEIILFPELASRLEPEVLLAHVRDALLAHDDAIVLRGLAFANLPPPLWGARPADVSRMRAFIRRLRAGIGGLTDEGHMLGLHVAGEPVVCAAWYVHPSRSVKLVITSPGSTDTQLWATFGALVSASPARSRTP